MCPSRSGLIDPDPRFLAGQRHSKGESGCPLNLKVNDAILNAQGEQRDCAHTREQDHQCHRVVVEPMPGLYTHDTPRPTVTPYVRPESEQNSSHLQIDCDQRRWQSSS